MNENLLINEFIQHLAKGAQFVSVTYTSKKHGETARYTLLVRQKYTDLIEKSILECEIRLNELKAKSEENTVQAMALIEQKLSLEESLKAHKEGRQHESYTKKDMYRQVVPGVTQFKDGTFELQGVQHSKVVLVPGTYAKVNHRNNLTAEKAKLRSELPVGKFKTLALDFGNIHSIRMNGQTVELE